jgi:hypothetical protein
MFDKQLKNAREKPNIEIIIAMGDANWCYEKWVEVGGSRQPLEEFGFHIHGELGKTTLHIKCCTPGCCKPSCKDPEHELKKTLTSALDHIYSTLSDTLSVQAFKIKQQKVPSFNHLPICAELARRQQSLPSMDDVRKRLSEMFMKLSPSQSGTPIGGDCMFKAIFDQLVSYQPELTLFAKDHKDLRSKLVYELASYLDKLHFLSGDRTPRQWQQQMLESGEHGDTQLLQLAAHVLNRKIIIVPYLRDAYDAQREDGTNVFEPRTFVQYYPSILLMYFNEARFKVPHYQSICRDYDVAIQENSVPVSPDQNEDNDQHQPLRDLPDEE